MAKHTYNSPSFTVSYWLYVKGKISYFKTFHKRSENFTSIIDRLILGHFFEPISKTYSISICKTQTF
jgi:hypothetical protein